MLRGAPAAEKDCGWGCEKEEEEEEEEAGRCFVGVVFVVVVVVVAAVVVGRSALKKNCTLVNQVLH